MRRIRHFVASAGLGAGLFSSAAVLSVTVGTAALVAGTGTPVQAAVADSGGASATADPASATPGSSVTFQAFCGSAEASSATLFGTTLGLPEQIPMDKESGGGVFSITVTLPGNILPSVYHPDIDCSDGSSATARIKVTPFPSQGGAATGDGTTATETNSGLAYGGFALIGIGAVAGGIAVRRRATRRS
jgi:hypothetical protein